MNMLGNANPSERDWDLFIERMNLFVTRGQKLGGGSVYDFREWMRRHGLIPPVFRD